MKNCSKIIAAVMVLWIGSGHAEASDFTDLFTKPKMVWYCSQSAAINGVTGISGVCASGLYYYTEMVSGFHDQNNPNEPKILCQNNMSCTPEPSVMYMGGTYLSYNSFDGIVPSLFRIYIPPGVTNINMQLYVSPVRVAAVVRMGQPPANPNKSVSEYGNIQSVGLLMNDVMNGEDLWTRNGDGHIDIFYGGGFIDQNKLLSKGFSDRWLYIQIVNYDSAWLQKLNFSMTIGDLSAYRNWYNSVNWACYDAPGTAACSSVASYTVTFQAGTGGTINGSTSQIVSENGSTSPVTAIPNANYTFVNWTGPNGFSSTSNSLTVSNVMAPATYTANFQQQQPQAKLYTVTANSSAGGTVTPTPQTVIQGGKAAFIATPNSAEYKFAEWTGTSCTSNSTVLTVSKNSTVLTVSNVQSDLTCTASFQALNKYNITAGPNGIVSSVANELESSNDTKKTISVYAGQIVSAMPASKNYRFVNWTGTNFESRQNPLQLPSDNSIPTNTTITANFEPVVLFFGTPENKGTTQTVGNITTAYPTQGYAVKWTDQYGNDVPSNLISGNAITITTPIEAATYVAKFFQTPYTVKFDADPQKGTIKGTTSQEVLPGGECTLVTAFGNLSSGTTKAYQFVNWTGKDSLGAEVTIPNSTDNPLKLSSVSKSMTITANFTEVADNCKTVNFVVSDVSSGSIVYDGDTGGTQEKNFASQIVCNGASTVKVKAIPDCKHTFVNWTGKDSKNADIPSINSTETSLTIKPDQDMKITANFAPLDLTGDARLGLEDVLYILRVLSGLQP